MNIGIIVYSQTGHTLSVATKLKEKLSTDGHTVNLEQVKVSGPTKPNIDAHDALVLGSPVQGGTMPPAMTSYLDQVPTLQGKRVVCLVTHFFPPGVGANQTLKQMTDICESKGAIVCGSGNVGWPRLGLKRQIADVVDDLSKLF